MIMVIIELMLTISAGSIVILICDWLVSDKRFRSRLLDQYKTFGNEEE